MEREGNIVRRWGAGCVRIYQVDEDFNFCDTYSFAN